MTEQTRKPFLHVVVCAAQVADGIGELITLALARNWDVGVVATPVATGFFDTAAVEAQTGRPVRSAWRAPREPRPFTDPDAVAVAPPNINTHKKWAAGISDTLALGTLCEAYGMGVPISVLPCVSEALTAHPAYQDSLARLRGMGVRFGEHAFGGPQQGGFRWEQALDLLGPPPR